MPYVQVHGLVGRESRVEVAAEQPQIHSGQERHAAAGFHQAYRRPARPRHEQRLVHIRDVCVHGVPVVHPEVQVELQRRRAAVLAVVVAVDGHHPDQVLGPGDGGERVAVPLAGREAPDGLLGPPEPALLVGGHPVVLPAVHVRAVGDVDDASLGILVAAVGGVQAAVDAQEAICPYTYIYKESDNYLKIYWIGVA